ncbi:GNAT family N-acetyltransferase [Streptococcus sp. Marseille-P7376]|uniref:GNAT family N-acetyltransferase n=1 Tax=Streptococcus sp. Marseille-P7376 TaxID=2592044 RepID=UPI0011E649DD|nr:GNAT family N-acetyltransferase [Streptococcus sp. Marseille-P7376]
MEIRIYSQPSQEIKDQLFELVQNCHVTDGTYRLPYLDNAYNFDAEMPAFFLANLDHQTVGFLSVYADEPGQAEVSVYVLPDYRRRGIANTLLQEFSKVAEKYDLSQIEYISEVKFLADHPTFAEKFDYDLKETEIWLEQAAGTFPEEEKEGLEVLLGKKEMVAEIAAFQSQIFGMLMETALHYASQALESPDSLLYVLKKDGQIVASCSVDTSFGSNYLFALAVDQAFQGQGLGSHLVRSILNDLASRNGQVCQIVVEAQNTGALRLYERLGFKRKSETVYLKRK